jgi:hypothetical protein
MKASIEKVTLLQSRINELFHEFNRLDGWTEEEVRDPQLGDDVDAIKAHLSNAIGRMGTCAFHIRRLAIRKGDKQ